MMEVRDYIQRDFPWTCFETKSLSSWDISIHFELAKGLYQFKSETDELNSEYFNQVYNQAQLLFNDIFATEDKILLVTNVYQCNDYLGRSKRK